MGSDAAMSGDMTHKTGSSAQQFVVGFENQSLVYFDRTKTVKCLSSENDFLNITQY